MSRSVLTSVGPRAVRPLSSMAARPAFDGEQAALYKTMFEQHLHPAGPWNMMLDAVRSALPSGRGRVLDLATGPGEPATLIGKALPGVQVIATDMSEDMIASAKKRAESLSNVKCQVADMTDLGAFYDNSFDVVTACYGYMFPDDKARALRETHRVLKPGGKLIATYWLEMQMLPLLGEVMTAVLGQTPPPPPQNPLSLKEPGVFEDMLVTAGFETPTVMESSYPFNIGTDPDFQYKLCAAVEPS